MNFFNAPHFKPIIKEYVCVLHFGMHFYHESCSSCQCDGLSCINFTLNDS